MWSAEESKERKELQINGLGESIAQIINVIDEEAPHTLDERIFLARTSQGDATAILAFLLNSMCLAGRIGSSSWLPLEEEIVSLAASLKLGKDKCDKWTFRPVFLSHSNDDEVVPGSNGDVLCMEDFENWE
ncbi:hypothetical protein DSL72_006390 [Monilinia vaccinii-corymbosi]|uniref:Phospholipase/carboxylesterase/thioesterase domain-containing protein n=1 Tax=Monilinia vaccinii-corymbosi TaxID=61207 RepID=A0A8A3PMY4_9HELO|nr:hypothetical protein DSL72_006390 [Monilinia vaccinii-corymbosi]